MTTERIRSLNPPEIADCEAILRALPRWFGIEKAIQQYCRDLERMETYVAERADRVVGFVTLSQHYPWSAEIHVMGVLEEFHRRGVGRALVERAEEVLRDRAVEFFQVKTLGPSRENAEYARTRRFYEAMGFRPLEETNLWGEANPCLTFVKHLNCARSGTMSEGK